MKCKVNYIMRNGHDISSSYLVGDMPEMERAYTIARKMNELDKLIRFYEVGMLYMVKNKDEFKTRNGIIIEPRDVVDITVEFLDDSNAVDE